MTVESTGAALAKSVNIEAVKEMVAQAVKQITMEMIKALMAGLRENLDFKGLAARHISSTHNEELSSSDEKVRMVYQKLFLATQEHIQKHSPSLVTTFAMINQQTGNSSDKFLCAFVLPAARSMTEKLKKAEQSQALTKEIWE